RDPRGRRDGPGRVRRTNMRRSMVTVALLMAAALAGAPAAMASRSGRTVIEVFPGPNALKTALASANPGDVLNIHAGTYPEHVTVTTDDVTLESAGDGTVTVDGKCAASVTVEITADGVAVQGLTVVGGSGGFAPQELDFNSSQSGSVTDSIVQDTCGDAEYGINVFNGGSIQITDNSASGFGERGRYSGQIHSTSV